MKSYFVRFKYITENYSNDIRERSAIIRIDKSTTIDMLVIKRAILEETGDEPKEILVLNAL